MVFKRQAYLACCTLRVPVSSCHLQEMHNSGAIHSRSWDLNLLWFPNKGKAAAKLLLAKLLAARADAA